MRSFATCRSLHFKGVSDNECVTRGVCQGVHDQHVCRGATDGLNFTLSSKIVFCPTHLYQFVVDFASTQKQFADFLWIVRCRTRVWDHTPEGCTCEF